MSSSVEWPISAGPCGRCAAHPTTSAIAILSLALGIGANTAIFSMINALLLRTLPVPAPQELRFVASNPAEPRVSWNYPDYLAFRDGAGVPLAAASGVRSIGLQTSEAAGEAAELAQSQFVTGNYFAVMGVRPEVGRLFNAADDRQLGAAPYAVLGYDYWRTRFGGDPGVVGRTIRVSGYPLTVIGVVRRGFKGTDPTTLPGLFVPLTMYSEVSREPAGVWNTRHYWWIRVIGRVPPGASVAALETRLTNIGRAQAEAERRENPRMGQRGTDLTDRTAAGRARLHVLAQQPRDAAAGPDGDGRARCSSSRARMSPTSCWRAAPGEGGSWRFAWRWGPGAAASCRSC